MKALLCEHWGSYRDLRIVDMPAPAVGRGQVRIAVHHVSVGFGQTLVIAGSYQRKPPLPFVPGTEISGVILECGPGVEGLEAGDRVMAALDWGGFAQEAVASAATTWKIPGTIDMATASTVPLGYGTAYTALVWRARIQSGDWLVVFGAAGGLGLAAVALGRALGAKVIAVAGSIERTAIAMEHGAHYCVVHTEGDVGRRIKEITGGQGAQIVLDPIGGDMTREATRCIAPEGRILVVGFASGKSPDIPANILLVKNIDVIGFNFGHYIGWGLEDKREFYAPQLKTMMKTLLALIEEGAIKAKIRMQYPFEEFVGAFDAIVQRQSVGRVVLDLPGVSVSI